MDDQARKDFDLSKDPDLMLALLAIFVKAQGGKVMVGEVDDIGPFALQTTVAEDDSKKRWIVLKLFEEPSGNA